LIISGRMVLDKKTVLTVTLLSVALFDTIAQIDECPPSARFQYYLHLAHTRTAANPSMDPLVESIDYSYYDMLWLGGDMAVSSSLDDMTMDHIDSILDVGNENTLWALGNHDYADLDRISAYTHRPSYYAYFKDKITFLVLDTQDSLSNVIGQQLELFSSVTDTLQTTTHLVLLHHKLIWMYGHSYLQNYINTIPNGGFGDCFYCINPNNFYTDLYPKLLELEAKGIEVICIAGDIGFRTNEFEYTTPEGVQFLASGIEAGNSNNQALVFKHDLVSDSLLWAFTSMSDLLAPRDTAAPVLHSILIYPEEIEKEKSIRITLETEDTLSGIDEIRLDIVNPLGEQLHALDTHLSDWISLGENTYAYDLLIADSAVIGRWTVSALSIVDSVGNLLCLNSRDSVLATFTVINPTGVSEEYKDDLHLYPNPSSGIIYLSIDPDIITIDVFNHIGEIIISNKSPESNKLDLTQVPPGLYLIRFNCSGDQKIMKRVLIY
jgi:hypothetical protein